MAFGILYFFTVFVTDSESRRLMFAVGGRKAWLQAFSRVLVLTLCHQSRPSPTVVTQYHDKRSKKKAEKAEKRAPLQKGVERRRSGVALLKSGPTVFELATATNPMMMFGALKTAKTGNSDSALDAVAKMDQPPSQAAWVVYRDHSVSISHQLEEVTRQMNSYKSELERLKDEMEVLQETGGGGVGARVPRKSSDVGGGVAPRKEFEPKSFTAPGSPATALSTFKSSSAKGKAALTLARKASVSGSSPRSLQSAISPLARPMSAPALDSDSDDDDVLAAVNPLRQPAKTVAAPPNKPVMAPPNKPPRHSAGPPAPSAPPSPPALPARDAVPGAIAAHAASAGSGLSPTASAADMSPLATGGSSSAEPTSTE